MRAASIVGMGLLIAATTALGAVASEARRPVPPPALPKPSFLSEFRIGLSAQDLWGPEEGSGNVVGEMVFAKPFTAADLFTSYFIPRPHFGGSLNFDGRTSFAYAGLTWTVDVAPRVFLEGSLGGAVHDGRTSPSVASAENDSLGCSPLFRESGSVGVRLSSAWSLMATVEHLSSGGLCSQNKGLTNFGARLGYTF